MIHFEQYNNIFAFADSLNRPNNHKFGDSSKESDFSGWAGTNTWTEADTLFRMGDKETADKLNRDFARIKATATAQSRKITPYYYGSSPIVARTVIGHPKAMRRTVTEKRPVAALHIVYNPSCSAGYSAKNIYRAGLCMLETVYRLELSGIRIDFDIVPFSGDISSRRDGKEHALCLVKLKQGQAPLDVLKIAYPIANTAMFRRHGFAWAETLPKVKHNVSNYGGEEKRPVIEQELKAKIPGDFRYIKFHDIIRLDYNAEKLINSIK